MASLSASNFDLALALLTQENYLPIVWHSLDGKLVTLPYLARTLRGEIRKCNGIVSLSKIEGVLKANSRTVEAVITHMLTVEDEENNPENWVILSGEAIAERNAVQIHRQKLIQLIQQCETGMNCAQLEVESGFTNSLIHTVNLLYSQVIFLKTTIHLIARGLTTLFQLLSKESDEEVDQEYESNGFVRDAIDQDTYYSSKVPKLIYEKLALELDTDMCGNSCITDTINQDLIFMSCFPIFNQISRRF
jgi:hypothetical protein